MARLSRAATRIRAPKFWSHDLRPGEIAGAFRWRRPHLHHRQPVDPTILFAINLVESKVQRLSVDPATWKVTPAKEIKLGETAALIEATP